MEKSSNRFEKVGMGMMSGTSIDGIDACLVRIKEDFSFEILANHSLEYPKALSQKLLDAANNKSSTSDICSLNFAAAKMFARCANELIEKTKIKPDFIASHGQTIYHIPFEKEMGGIKTASTLQIGDISVIAQETGVCTIGNFRTRDIAAGGQGAPLVPFADELIFKREVPRAIQNLGGISNVTVLSPDCETFAFDTGPANMLIDYFSMKLFKQPFDKNGQNALKGKADSEFVNKFCSEEYYFRNPPKTTGREFYNEDYCEKLLMAAPKDPYDAIASVTALSAKTIADSYKMFIFPKTQIKEMVLGGGGAYNQALLGFLKKLLPNLEIVFHEDFKIDSKFKEALAFAFLGYCTLHGIPNNLPSCTGAKEPVVMGEIAF